MLVRRRVGDVKNVIQLIMEREDKYSKTFRSEEVLWCKMHHLRNLLAKVYFGEFLKFVCGSLRKCKMVTAVHSAVHVFAVQSREQGDG